MSKPKKEEPKSNDKNEYIPSFIAKKPFYVDGDEDDYLEHQRLQSEQNKDSVATSKWYDRGQRLPAATKYRKGACENCGALTHKAKDCLERKRKHGAKYTGKNIAADEVIEDIKLGWDAKRDRWNGYDTKQFEEVIEDYKSKETETKYEETETGATRALRLREDTAKYLVNLDTESADYDPKTRTLDADEGFERASGDAAEFERAQRYAWEAQEKGGSLHLQANPTEGELVRKRKAEEDLKHKEAKKALLLEAYGTQEFKKPLTTATETYIEYDKRGRVKGVEEKSMYAEDIHINNHTSVWGSWWKDFKWGYACCHSTLKNSYCVGEDGKRAADESEALREGRLLEPTEEIKATKPLVATDEARRRMEASRTGVTDDQIEQYRREKSIKNDPMAAHLGKDELIGAVK